jgi:hypothetical protein
MVDLALKKAKDHQIGKNNIAFPSVLESGNVTQKVTTDDLMKIKHKSLQSVVMAAHTLLNGETAQRDGRMLLPPLELSRIGKTIIDPEIIEFIASMMTNKGLIPRDVNDLRAQIDKTAAQSGVFVMDKTAALRKAGALVYESLVSRESHETADRAKEHKPIFNYAALPASDDGTGHVKSSYNVEAYKSTSKERRPNTGNVPTDLPHLLDITSNEPAIFNQLAGLTKERYVGGLGKKYNFANMVREDIDTMPDRENR